MRLQSSDIVKFSRGVVQDTTATMTCDDLNSNHPNGSNDVFPSVPIMADLNTTHLRCRSPFRTSSQHALLIGPLLASKDDKENGNNLASIMKNATINNFNRISANGSVSRQLHLSQESESNSNINILAMAASAASVVRPTAPSGQPFLSATPSNLNAPLNEIDVNTLPFTREDSSPLTASTLNESSRGDVERVTAAVSTSNAAYQTATDGAYLSVPASNCLRIIGCVNEDAHDLGYDSDGELGPFFDAVDNEQAFEGYEEEAVGVSTHTTCPPPPLQVQPNSMAALPQLSEEIPNLSEEIIRAMKVPELRNALKSRNQAVRGNKDALIQRLLSCMNDSNVRHGAAAVVTNDNQQPPTETHHGVRWRLLEPNATPLQEPNTIPGLVAPTTHAAGTESEAKKYDYEEVFDRDPFTATSKEWVRNKHWHPENRSLHRRATTAGRHTRERETKMVFPKTKPTHSRITSRRMVLFTFAREKEKLSSC